MITEVQQLTQVPEEQNKVWVSLEALLAAQGGANMDEAHFLPLDGWRATRAAAEIGHNPHFETIFMSLQQFNLRATASRGYIQMERLDNLKRKREKVKKEPIGGLMDLDLKDLF